MTRIVILAAAAALVALPASAESIHISTVGKSPEQVKSEVLAAATKLCAREMIGATFWADEMHACVTGAVHAALAQSSDPQLKLAAR